MLLSMDIEGASGMLAELGHPHRLSAFRLLVKTGPDGLPVKDIQAHLGIPKSTLSHHITHLVWAGIVIQTREGRVLRCRIDYDRVHGLLDYLTEDCCAGIHDYLGHDHARAGGRASP